MDRDTPRPALLQEPVLSMEQRFERLEFDVRQCVAFSVLAIQYMQVIATGMGLREKAKEYDKRFEKIKNGDFED